MSTTATLRSRRRPARPSSAGAPLVLALLLLAAGCRKAPPGFELTPLDEPVPDSVELVLYVIGDAGEALPGASPVLAALTREIEAWSGGLGRDSAVAVLFVGDNVYPSGIHDPTDPSYPGDTLRMRAQLDVVGGPNARRYRTASYFLAGNHDWGNMSGPPGLARLRNQEAFIHRVRESEGLLVDLLPDAGDPGPELLDIGERVRILFLDTHWWLQERATLPKQEVLAAVEEGIRTAGERHVILTAHHPFASGGAHGGPVPIWEGLGIYWLLRQTGSIVQDLNAVVYRDLLFGLKEVFARVGRPLIFAAGHDHSLQVLEDVAPDEPFWNLVSGAGSKTADVAMAEGMLYGEDRAGFMRVTFMQNGSVFLHVLATDGPEAVCEEVEGNGSVETCVQEGLASFDTRFALRLN